MHPGYTPGRSPPASEGRVGGPGLTLHRESIHKRNPPRPAQTHTSIGMYLQSLVSHRAAVPASRKARRSELARDHPAGAQPRKRRSRRGRLSRLAALDCLEALDGRGNARRFGRGEPVGLFELLHAWRDKILRAAPSACPRAKRRCPASTILTSRRQLS